MKLIEICIGKDEYAYVNPEQVVSLFKIGDSKTQIYTVENKEPIVVLDNINMIKRRLEKAKWKKQLKLLIGKK